MDRILVFDIWGEYAHFRKYYTTTSPLTFSIPPRTAISGIIGGILGFKKHEYLNHFSKDQANIGVQILNPIKKVRISENLIDTKKASMMSRIKTRTQIRFEFLKDAKYRIYFYHKDSKLMETLKAQLQEHKTVYTPYLGLTEHIANFDFQGEFDVRKVEFQELKIGSAVPEKLVTRINFEDGGEYFSETMPLEMNHNRIVTEYGKVIFERNGRKISAEVKEAWALNKAEDEIITFL
jgi:CRISPR-associated protein Cas5h